MRLLALVIVALVGCCPYEAAGDLRVVGSAVGFKGTPREPELLLVYDPKNDRMAWVDRKEFLKARAK